MGSSPVGVTTETSEKQLFSLVFASYSGYFGSLPPIFPQNNKNKKSFFVRLAAFSFSALPNTSFCPASAGDFSGSGSSSVLCNRSDHPPAPALFSVYKTTDR